MNTLFDTLWEGYTSITPSAKEIHQLFEERGEEITNDHIAIRTFNDARVDINRLAIPFKKMGYVESGEYHFPAKKLYAKHYQIPGNSAAPKVFISELRLELMSKELKQAVELILDSVDQAEFESEELVLKGRLWSQPKFALYDTLRAESEYAAWMYLYGFCANHFTVNVNKLRSFSSLEKVNEMLLKDGFSMNVSGGIIKGTSEQMLEQSSILADMMDFAFVEGKKRVPTCYYEFALRYPQANGELFDGFIAESADKIFESTDLKLQQS